MALRVGGHLALALARRTGSAGSTIGDGRRLRGGGRARVAGGDGGLRSRGLGRPRRARPSSPWSWPCPSAPAAADCHRRRGHNAVRCPSRRSERVGVERPLQVLRGERVELEHELLLEVRRTLVGGDGAGARRALKQRLVGVERRLHRSPQESARALELGREREAVELVEDLLRFAIAAASTGR